jgi:hypothetical protein
MIKINIVCSSFESFIERTYFKKIYALNWIIDGNSNDTYCMNILKKYLIDFDIKYKIKHKCLGSLADSIITFNSCEDEVHFILLLSAIKS